MNTPNTPERPHSRTRFAGLVAVAVAASGVVAFIANATQIISSFEQHSPVQSSVTNQPVLIPRSTLVPGESMSSAISADAPVCVSSNYEQESCAAQGAWLVETDSPCDEDGLLSRLGFQPDLQAIDVEILDNDRCLLRPGDVSASAGATAADLLDPSIHDTGFGKVSTCLDDSSKQTPCTLSHKKEAVGQWHTLEPGTNPSASCEQPVRKFVGMTLDATGKLQYGMMTNQSAGTYRCIVTSAVPLQQSVWHLSGAPLPTEAVR